MPERKTQTDYCCSPEGDLKPRLAPEYTVEGTVEQGILAASEIFFTERDETLRYDLVKRLIQWMLDTNENAFFDETEISDPKGSFPGAFTSVNAMRSLLQTIRMDVAGGQLTGEIDALHEFLQTIDDDVPEQYAYRYRLLKKSVNPQKMLPDLKNTSHSQGIAKWMRGNKLLG